jgi:hypothetical protein
MTVMGCQSLSGYAPLSGDCNDRDAKIHPGAPEVCDLLDDNCDGRIDEQVRPRCGVGWCERLSASCDVAACVPGLPIAESCNGADDDCNGVVDDAPDLCAPGFSCRTGVCAPGDVAVSGGASAGGTSGGDTATSGSGGSSGGLASTGGVIFGDPVAPPDSTGASHAHSAGCALSRDKRGPFGPLSELLLAALLTRALSARRRRSRSRQPPLLP